MPFRRKKLGIQKQKLNQLCWHAKRSDGWKRDSDYGEGATNCLPKKNKNAFFMHEQLEYDAILMLHKFLLPNKISFNKVLLFFNFLIPVLMTANKIRNMYVFSPPFFSSALLLFGAISLVMEFSCLSYTRIHTVF